MVSGDIVSDFVNYSMGNDAYYECVEPGYSAQFLVGVNSNKKYCACVMLFDATTMFEVSIDATYSRKGKGNFFAEETTVHLQMTRCSN
jgi:hypothetical protein